MIKLRDIQFVKNIVLNNPSHVYLHYSDECNLRCIQCNIWNMKKLPTLKYAQKIFILNKLMKSIGPFYLSLNGGELFLNKTIFKFISYCEKNNIQMSIVSNGTLFDEKMAKKISRYNNLKIIFSLDSATDKTHDFLRGVSGTYRKVLGAIDLLHKSNFYKIGINTVISSQNIDELSEIVALCTEKGIKELNFQPISLGLNSDFKKHILWPKDFKKTKSSLYKLILLKDTSEGKIIANQKDEFERFVKYFKNPFDKNEKCYVSSNAIRIDRYGNLYLCMGIKKSYGNILRDEFKNIFNSPAKKILNKKISTCDLPCKFMTCNRKRNLTFYINKAKMLLNI